MIVLDNVCKSFEGTQVLKNISLHIKEGECIVLSGVSGSGKSTLLSIIASLSRASSGDVSLDEIDLSTLNDIGLSNLRSKTVTFVTQEFYLLDMLSTKENIMPPLVLSGLSQKEIDARVGEVMELVGIKAKAELEVRKLSGGEKQRCTIARALVGNPKILLFDEPTANLDKANSMKFIEILKILKAQGKTVVIATHDPLVSDLTLIDNLISLKDGEVE